ncbi:PLP-dependent aminotransferase family protein, partial [Rhodopseudomonas palustris]|nr:PLP-dependent aminotransferase family protein [Rhodopseudomonas palustris]
MAIWTPSLKGRRGTRALALVEAMRADIMAGLLAPGDRLPPQRDLAYRLGLSPHTVMRAYAEAARRGYVRGEVGRGTYVSSPVCRHQTGEDPVLRRPEIGPVDFSRNLPFVGESEQALAATLADLVRAGGLADYLDHESNDVALRHRRAGAAWVAMTGLSTSVEKIILTCGAQQGIFATFAAVLHPGDVLLTEALTYAPVKSIARHLGVRIVGLPMDRDGICPEAIEAACRQHPARALYITPTLQTPTAVTMGERRRRIIAHLADAHDLILIEDDVFGLLPQSVPDPVAAFAPQRSVYITGLSKTAAPGLRVGFVHAPDRLVGAIRNAVIMSSWMPPPLMSEIAAQWVADGTAEKLKEGQRAHASRRQAMACGALAGFHYHTDPFGSHLWLSLPEHWQADAFSAAAADFGVRV